MRFLISLSLLISTALGADFTTDIGGADPDRIFSVAAIATDRTGDTYVAGTRAHRSGTAPTDVFVTKLDATGNVVSTKTFGGQCCSWAYAIATDPVGNIWVGGQTFSPDFPLVRPIQSMPESFPGLGSGFLVKISPHGNILYSSYFGGVLGVTTIYGIACDQSGNVYVTGMTDATDFPTTPGLPAGPVSADESAHIFGAFVTKLDPTGQKIIYSALIGHAEGSGIAVDKAGNAFAAGSADSSDLPVTIGGTSSSGAFALKIDAAGNKLDYLTFIGSTSTTVGNRPIAVDAPGNAFITGYSNSPEAFAMKLDPTGKEIWTTFLGVALNGSRGNAVGIDNSGNVWLTGGDGSLSAQGRSFVDQLSADGSTLLYSVQVDQTDAEQDLVVDRNGLAHVAGLYLVSAITPGPRLNSIFNAASGGFNGMVAPGEIISLYGNGMGSSTPVGAVPLNGRFPVSLGGIQVLLNGAPIPLLYVSDTQINAEIPSSLQADENGLAVVQVMNASAALQEFRVAVATSVFGAFDHPLTDTLSVINQDGTLNTPENRAAPGSYVSVYGSGFGRVPGYTIDGAVATAANNYCSSCQVRILIDRGLSVTETVQYFGPSPGLIDGLIQINFQIPAQGAGFVYFTVPGSTQSQLLGLIW